MTRAGAVDRSHRAAPAARSRADRWPRVLWWAGTVLLGVLVVHIAALVITGGPLTGPVSLRKPATFAETGWLVAWSVALILPTLRVRSWQSHVIGAAVVVFGIVETTVMAIQAWRGVPSHYNFTTPLDTVLMRGGAAGTAAIFVVGMVVLLVATLRSTPTPTPVRLGVCAGVVVTLVAGAVGFIMILNNSGVYQGSLGVGFGRSGAYLGPDAATVGPEHVLLRLSTAGGDLVLPHAIGVHGLILLAVPAVLLARTATSFRRQLGIVLLAVAAVVTAIAILLIHAGNRLPLDQLSSPALAALAGCGAALVAAYAATVTALLAGRRARRPQPSARAEHDGEPRPGMSATSGAESGRR